MQGFVHRADDARFAGRSAVEAIKSALSDENCLMINRNAGAGTRVLIDQLLGACGPRATATSRARTTRSPPQSRRGAPTGHRD